ncbi:MAG: serine/threonine-protein phosphatase [Rhodocyclaceae bacterium]|nr:MAG: serine/threonine-protein phosphatase [Rhodocyclaceae bacterium]
MKLEIAALSKQGGRSHNEDACGYWTSDAGCCWVVSDGAGGHGGGDVAAKTVVSNILRDFAACPAVAPERISELILRANQAVLLEQATSQATRNMRATAAVLEIDNVTETATWGHLGDTRIYVFRGCRVLFQSRDHSVMQTMVDAGFGDAAMLRTHPQRSVLLAALGTTEEIRPAVHETVALRDGDVFLLCTDGLWEYVDEAAMERLLAASLTAEYWLAALEAEVLAHAKRDHDNYSALAVWVGNPADATRIITA